MRRSILAAGLIVAMNVPAAFASTPPTITLEQLEKRVILAPQVSIAEDAAEAQRYALDEAQAKTGLTFLSSVTAGAFRGPTSSTTAYGYQSVVAQAGVRYPLFGEGVGARDEVATQAATLAQRNVDVAIAKAQTLQQLRTAYASYWASQQKIALERQFQTGEREVEAALDLRKRAGLLLRSDELQTLTSYELLRRDEARFQRDVARALSDIDILTASHLEAFVAVEPRLRGIFNDHDAFIRAALEQSAAVQESRSMVSQTEVLVRHPASAVHGGVSVVQSGGAYHPATAPATSTSVALDMAFPVGAHAIDVAEAHKDAALLKQAKNQLSLVEARVKADAEDAWFGYAQAQQALVFAEMRLRASKESVRESMLRYGKLASETIDLVERSRFQYYADAVAEIDARQELYRRQAAMAFFATSESAPATTTGSSTVAPEKPKPKTVMAPPSPTIKPAPSRAVAAAATPAPAASATTAPKGAAIAPIVTEVERLVKRAVPSTPKTTAAPQVAVVRARPFASQEIAGAKLGVYVWNAQAVLAAAANDGYWQTLASQHIARLLLSLNGSELRQIAIGDPLRKRLESFLQEASSHGVRVSALLGEPTWLLPEGRADLIAIVKGLRNFRFSSVELDLEPNQLDGVYATQKAAVDAIAQTAAAAARVSAVPVSVTVNVRYLVSKSKRRSKSKPDPEACLPCLLEQSGIRHMTLMVYIANPVVVANEVLPIVRAYPNMSFSIAQSVEPQLPRSESYAWESRQAFLSSMERLTDRLKERNFNDVVVQSYDDYLRLRS